MREKKYSAVIGSLATAIPSFSVSQSEARKFVMKHYSKKLSPKKAMIMDRVFSHPSILKRNFAIDNPDVLLEEEPDSRAARFEYWSVELAAKAVEKALKQSGLAANSIIGIVVNTCTGYMCPGISTYLIERLGLSRRIRAYDLVGSGCGGALPNLEISRSILNENHEDAVVSVSVEICSAAFQMDDDLSLIISNAIFSDGAAAAVIRQNGPGLEFVGSASLYKPEYREDVRFVYKNGNLHNRISVRLPRLVKEAVGDVVQDLLERHSLQLSDLRHWAVHAGGDKIVAGIKDELGLTEEQLRPTMSVLANYGNMSSVTVWFVIDEILKNGIERNDWCIAITFGAGFSIHAFLLRKK